MSDKKRIRSILEHGGCPSCGNRQFNTIAPIGPSQGSGNGIVIQCTQCRVTFEVPADTLNKSPLRIE